MTVEYNNRYRDRLFFTENENEIVMTGAKYLRYGYDEDPSEVNMVDPSGGPYIEIGTNLRHIFKDGKDRFVEAIEILEHTNSKPSELGEPIDVLFKIKNYE